MNITPKLLKFNFLFRFESYKDTLLIYPSLKCAFHLFVYHIFKKNTAYSKKLAISLFQAKLRSTGMVKFAQAPYLDSGFTPMVSK